MKKYNDIMLISADVYTVIKSMNNVGWSTLRESSINRILYLSAVVFSFMFDDRKNFFVDNYNFIITLGGPEDPIVSKAIINLEANEVIKRTDDGLSLISNQYENIFKDYPLYFEKKEWIDDISYIFGIYGEDRIYDFVFRDPQYQKSLKTNTQYTLDLTKRNATVAFLYSFKTEFESNARKFGKDFSVNNRQYLSMYFEYVFGKILRGDL